MNRNKRALSIKEILLRKKEYVEGLLNHPSLEEFRKAGLVNEYKLRDFQITSYYLDLRKTQRHLPALEMTAEKFFISPESVLKIIYKKHPVVI